MSLTMYEKRDRLKLWCAIRALERFSIVQLAERCDVAIEHTRNYVFMLRRHGYCDWQQGDKDNTNFFLIKDTGALPPVQGSEGVKDPNMAGRVEDANQRMWKAVVMLGNWDCYSLAAHAEVAYASALRYSKGLAAHEYAKCVARDRCGTKSRDRYRLCRMTGAIAPLFLESGEVFDANEFLKELWALKSKKSRRKSA